MIWEPTKEGIQEAFLEHKEDIRYCYEAWLDHNPDLEGRLEIAFSIPAERGEGDPEGVRLLRVDVEGSDVDHSFFEGCVLGVLSDLHFAPPEKDVEGGRIPIVFRSATD